MPSYSQNRLAWNKFRSNKLSLISLYYILFWVVLSVFVYLIAPDNTPDANGQMLDISMLPPNSQVEFIQLKEKEPPEECSLLEKIGGGAYKPYRLLPVAEVLPIEGNTLLYKKYSKVENNDAPYYRLNTNELYFEKGRYKQTKTFYLGTDKFGRDLLSRLLVGSRVSLSVGLISVFISLIIGLFMGAVAGYYGGKIDAFITWLINVTWSIPTLLLVIAITLAIGKGFVQIFIAVGLTMWVEVARVVRGQVLSIREKEYVEAAVALGYSDARIIRQHILPNVMSPIIVISAANFASAILMEAGLSFLGIGVQPPMPSWGTMIKETYGYIVFDDRSYMALIPGIAIMLLVLAFILVGNGLRDAFDSKSDT